MLANNFLLNSILRVLTPEEINELTTTSTGENRVSLTDIINQRLDGVGHDFSDNETMAKILPFKRANEQEEDVEEAVEVQAGDRCNEFIERFLERRKVSDTALDSKGELVETSSFIFKEKERFAYSQAKLKQKEVLGLYKQNAAVDVDQVRALKDDLSQSAQSGVLVNKKQY
jgi:hypothetical protein